MKISGRREHLFSLENVAMTDIIMNMFIFFFISFSLLYTFSPDRIQKLDVKLPGARNTAPIVEKDQINVVVANDGLIYFEDKRVEISELKDGIRARLENNPKLAVILRADKAVQFKRIVNILDMLNELEITRLSIAAVND